MKARKRIISFILALLMTLSWAGGAYAAAYDIKHADNFSKDTDIIDFSFDFDIFFEVARNSDKYYFGTDDGKYYLVKEIDDELIKGAEFLSDAILNLQPFIMVKGDSDTEAKIDDILEKNRAQYDASHYTADSWAAYENAREELSELLNHRFVRERLLNEKIEKLVAAKAALDELIQLDLSELRALVEEGEAMDLSPYTDASAGAYMDAIQAGRDFINNPANKTEDDLADLIADIKAKKNALEESFELKIESIMDLPRLTVSLDPANTIVELPKEVTAVMTDKSHKNIPVNWDESITDGQVGEFEITGTADGHRTTLVVAVVEADKFVDKSDLVEAIRRGQAASESKYTPRSYRELREALENANRVNDDPNASPEEIAKAKDRIVDALANLVEQESTDRIVYIENPAKINAKVADVISLPDKVTVVLNSGAKLSKPVVWTPDHIDTSTVGTKTAEGRVEGTNHRATLTVEVTEQEAQADKSGLQNAINQAKAVDRNAYTPASLAAMDQALAWAEDTNKDPNAEQASVDKAKENLLEAIDALEKPAENPTITNLKPDADQNLKKGRTVTISFDAPAGGEAGYRIALPGSSNRSVINPNMTEIRPGYYEATWTVPDGYNGQGFLVFVSFTDSNGNSAFETAVGKINIVQELQVTYKMETPNHTEKVNRGGNPAHIPESDKEGYKVSWKMNGLTVDPRTVAVHEDITFVADYTKDPSQWVTVKFALPSGVEFKDGAKTEYEILKTQTLREQNVVTPDHKVDTLPVGKKLQWNIGFDSKLTENITYTAELVRDDGQFKTISVEVGANGSLINPENNTFEVLKTAEQADIIAQAKGLVQADDYYQIGDIVFDQANNKVSVSFKKDPSKWVTVKFVNGAEELFSKEVHIGQSYKQAGIESPDVKPDPGQKLVWTPKFDFNAQIEKIENSNEIVFKASFEKDQSQYTIYTVLVDGDNGSLKEENKNTFEVLNTASEEEIKAQAKKLVQADDNYQIGAITIADNTVSVSFEKDPTKWVDVTLKAGENLKLRYKGKIRNEDIILNVLIGTRLSALLTEEDIEFSPTDGYMFSHWDPASEIIDADHKDFTAIAKENPDAWVTIKFEAGEHGQFKEADRELASQKVLVSTNWNYITPPGVEANEAYIFTGWNPEIPKDKKVENQTFIAQYKEKDDLSYTIKFIQVDENGNKIIDYYGKPVEIKDSIVVKNYETEVEVKAPELEPGIEPENKKFELYGDANKTLTIDPKATEHVVEFTYKAKVWAIEKAKEQIAKEAEKNINKVVSQDKNNIDFSFNLEERTVYFNLKNPQVEALTVLFKALSGSGIFEQITGVTDMKTVSFAGDKIILYNADGSRKPANDVKSELVEKVKSVLKAFGFEIPDNVVDIFEMLELVLSERPLCAQWHGIVAPLKTEGQTTLGNERIWVKDNYYFKFRVTDREVSFDADGKGTFDNESIVKITKHYHESLGADLPVFKAKDGYKVEKYLVTYTSFKTPKEVGITEFDEEALSKLIVQESKEVNADELKDLKVEHNMVIKPITTEDASQWVNVRFVLPEGVEPAENAQIEYKVLKTKTLVEQGVTIPDHKAGSVPEGQKVVWENINLDNSLSEDKTFTAKLEKDPDKYRTITVVAGDHGKLKDAVKDNFEVLRKTATDESIKAQAKELVQANEGYIIDSLTLDGDTANVSFKVDETKTLSYTVKYFLNDVEQSEWQIDSKVFLADPSVKEVEDKKPEYYDLDSANSTPLPFTVSEKNNEIVVKYVRPKVTISFELEGDKGTISSSNPISVLKGSKWIDVKSKMPTTKANDGYLVKYEPALPTDDNYVFTEDTVYKIRFVKEGYALGDKQIADKNIVNRVYNDNSKKADPIGKVKILKDGEDVSASFTTFKYYDKKDGSEITDFDLSKGGQTFQAYMVASGEGGLKTEGQVYFKYGSVTIGKDSTDFLTMEDALAKANEGDQIVVKYNTSFAEKAIGQDLYGTIDHTINKGVTVLLPFDDKYSDNIEDKSAPQDGRGKLIDRKKGPFVKLTLPQGQNLDIAGTLTLNAITRGNHESGTGKIYMHYYSQLEMGANSKINVKSAGRLNSIGFVIGNGEMVMESGSEVLDLLMLHDYRGGGETTSRYRYVFPTDQFSMNNIEVPITINAGSKYMAMTHLILSETDSRKGEHFTPTVGIIGGDDTLLNLKSGYIRKTYNIPNGKMNFDVYGNLELKDLTLQLETYVTASTKDKEIPFCGLYNINIKSGSSLTTIANAKLLPDMKLTIDQGATMNISNGSHVFVYGPNKYLDSEVKWGKYMRPEAPATYRVIPTFGINRNNPGQLIVNGTLNVNGGLAGPVKKGADGEINFHEGSEKTLTIIHFSFLKKSGLFRPKLKRVTEEFREIK